MDWDRVTFTMDDHYYKAVIKVFVELYNKGLIYRGARMINWDPSAKTALSDEEVEHKDVLGKLYYVRYLIVDSQQSTVDHIVIATQRPETIMGDTAVCVNPNDERYAHLKNKKVIVPLVNREVPVIFDDYVDPTFGTGALKITPAHDINDYNLGIKYNLPVIDTLNEDGTLSNAAEVFVGLDRFVARKKVVEQLKAEGLLVKEEDYQTRVGFSQRTNAVVEPKISTQWFLKMKELAGPALIAVLNGDIKIHPEEKFINTYKYWLENVKDWCISRQLWWGQQIPAWYDTNGNVYVSETKDEAVSLELRAISKNTSGLRTPDSGLIQDEDVLDTWFSSWLWPIEVFKGITDPNNNDIKYYYPTSVLVTGQDIFFLWVARMIMAGYEFKNEKPFSDVYFTGMVRDKQGRKMSKSLGNSPDLLDLIDKYGADAVRFGIMISSPAGNDLLFDEASLEQGRHFNNKLWNALKLVKMWSEKIQEPSDKTQENFAVEWFENRLNEAKMQVDELLKNFKLSEALKTIYSLIWDDFCSWYLEWIKPDFQQPIDKNIFDRTIYFFEELMQLLHPFMPFITEEIYHLLKDRNDDLCVKQENKPVSVILNESYLLTEMSKILIQKIRETRNKRKVKNTHQVTVYADGSFSKLSDLNDRLKIANAFIDTEKKVRITGETPKDIGSTLGVEQVLIETNKFYFDFGNLKQKIVNTDLQDQIKNDLIKDIEYQKGFLESVLKKLNNRTFCSKCKTRSYSS